MKEKKKRIELERKENPAARIPKNENEFNQALDSIENLFTKKFDFSKVTEQATNGAPSSNGMSVDQDGLADSSSIKQQLKNKKLKMKKKNRKLKSTATPSKKDGEWEDIEEDSKSVNNNTMEQSDDDEDDGIIRPGMGASLSKISKPKKISKGKKREKKKNIERALAYQERRSNEVVKKIHSKIKGLI